MPWTALRPQVATMPSFKEGRVVGRGKVVQKRERLVLLPGEEKVVTRRVTIEEGGKFIYSLEITAPDATAACSVELSADVGQNGKFLSLITYKGISPLTITRNVVVSGQNGRADLVLRSEMDSQSIVRADDHISLEGQGATGLIDAKTALHDHARSQIRAKVSVPAGVADANVRERIEHLMLSPAARAEAIPELDLRARKVDAAHAVTVRALDAEALAYLSGRGLDATTRTTLLTKAFLAYEI